MARPAQAADVQSAAEAFEAVIAETLDVLAHERMLFLTGAYGELEGVTGKKTLLLARIEETVPFAPRTRATIGAIEDLVIASRRNEEIIQAARQGLAHARRRISSIQQAKQGVVAYAEDGSQISSRADLFARDKSA